MSLSTVKLALRVLARRKFFTFVSLFGIGFTLVVLMVGTAVVDHMLLPRPPEIHRDRMLLVARMKMSGEQVTYNGGPGFGFLDKYCRDLDGVERTSIAGMPQGAVTYRDAERVDLQLRYTDGEYWHLFDFEFLAGAPFTAEDDAEGRPIAVITEDLRRRLFGEEPALGRSFELAGRDVTVVGVVAPVGRDCFMAFSDAWVPIGAIPDPSYRDEIMGDFMGLLLAESRDAIPRIKDDFRPRLERVEFQQPDRFNRLEGAPLTLLEITASQTVGGGEPSAPALARFIGLVVALVLAFMLLPAINLVNLNLSRIYERMAEIGVRKAFGASSWHIVRQLVGENVLLCLIGGLIGFVGSVFVLAAINRSGIVPHAAFAVNPRVFLVGMALAVFFGILSGAYPAWRISRVHPVLALRGETK